VGKKGRNAGWREQTNLLIRTGGKNIAGTALAAEGPGGQPAKRKSRKEAWMSTRREKGETKRGGSGQKKKKKKRSGGGQSGRQKCVPIGQTDNTEKRVAEGQSLPSPSVAFIQKKKVDC